MSPSARRGTTAQSEQFASGTIDFGPYVGLRDPTARLVIGMQTATPAQAESLGAGSIEHLSSAVSDRASLESIRAELLSRGVDVSEVFEEALSYTGGLRDPDGLVHELTAPKPR